MVFVGAQLGEERVGDDLALAAFDGVVVADGAAFLDDAVGGVAGVFEVADDLIDRIAAHPEDYDVAANRDPNARLEAETPDD